MNASASGAHGVVLVSEYFQLVLQQKSIPAPTVAEGDVDIAVTAEDLFSSAGQVVSFYIGSGFRGAPVINGPEKKRNR